MLPIEYCNLPQNLVDVKIYIDGKKAQFQNRIYIKNGIALFPNREICDYATIHTFL
jgi:hypothetical protein